MGLGGGSTVTAVRRGGATCATVARGSAVPVEVADTPGGLSGAAPLDTVEGATLGSGAFSSFVASALALVLGEPLAVGEPLAALETSETPSLPLLVARQIPTPASATSASAASATTARRRGFG